MNGRITAVVHQNLRVLCVTVLVASLLMVAGCALTNEYSTSVSEPTTGAVIQNLTVTDVNELDGAQFEFENRLNASNDSNYIVYLYDRTNDSDEVLWTSGLSSNEPTYQNNVPTPGDTGEEAVYDLEIVHRQNDSDDVVDAATITMTRDE